MVDNEFYKFVGIAPSSLHFHQIKNFFEQTSIQVGFQDIDIDGGARTGSISASMASNDGCAHPSLDAIEADIEPVLAPPSISISWKPTWIEVCSKKFFIWWKCKLDGAIPTNL